MERKLVTIRKVSELRPIPGADLIELALVDGWQCVVKKGEFKPGDLGVYFEIDSFLPIDPKFEFLRKSSYKKMADGREGFRIKTVKLRGQLSQGLFLSLFDFPDLLSTAFLNESYQEALNVVKYEPPIPAELSGEVIGTIPGTIRKTDAERIQNLPDYFVQYKDEPFEITEKLDGSSCTIFKHNDMLGVCGRNYVYAESATNSYWRATKPILENLKNYGNYALQGELIGEGVNKNRYKLRGQHFYLFSIWDIENHCYLTPDQRRDFLDCWNTEAATDTGIGLNHVPVIAHNEKIFQKCTTMEQLLEYTQGESLLYHTIREGLVFKSHSNTDIIFKAVSNAFLLKED